MCSVNFWILFVVIYLPILKLALHYFYHKLILLSLFSPCVAGPLFLFKSSKGGKHFYGSAKELLDWCVLCLKFPCFHVLQNTNQRHLNGFSSCLNMWDTLAFNWKKCRTSWDWDRCQHDNGCKTLSIPSKICKTFLINCSFSLIFCVCLFISQLKWCLCTLLWRASWKLV